jgi:hypothetical protein
MIEFFEKLSEFFRTALKNQFLIKYDHNGMDSGSRTSGESLTMAATGSPS